MYYRKILTNCNHRDASTSKRTIFPHHQRRLFDKPLPESPVFLQPLGRHLRVVDPVGQPAFLVVRRAHDVEATRLISEYVTDPAHLTAWTDHIPESATVPSPRDELGYVVGTPGEITPADTINQYFRTLAAA